MGVHHALFHLMTALNFEVLAKMMLSPCGVQHLRRAGPLLQMQRSWMHRSPRMCITAPRKGMVWRNLSDEFDTTSLKYIDSSWTVVHTGGRCQVTEKGSGRCPIIMARAQHATGFRVYGESGRSFASQPAGCLPAKLCAQVSAAVEILLHSPGVNAQECLCSVSLVAVQVRGTLSNLMFDPMKSLGEIIPNTNRSSQHLVLDQRCDQGTRPTVKGSTAVLTARWSLRRLWSQCRQKKHRSRVGQLQSH
eukprot:3062634-Amphidinium_carterae.2